MNINIGETQTYTTDFSSVELVRKYISKRKIAKRIIYEFIKRSLDIVLGLVGMIALFVVTIAVWVTKVILKENDGPIFYKHLRYGKDGKQFYLYKYRSMCVDSKEKLEEYLSKNEKARKEFAEYQKLYNDPRITKVGNILRKTSLDELPQIINVLKGEMSFVGPRPVVEGEIDRYGEDRAKFLSVKPGITRILASKPEEVTHLIKIE